MKISEVTARILKTKPHPFDEDTIVSFINSLEQQVQAEVLETPIANRIDYTWADNSSTVLLMPPPYDSCYLFYVAARIDFDLGEFESYNQNMMQFNTLYDEYKKYYIRQNQKESPRIQNIW